MGPATFSKEKATAPCREVTASNRRGLPLFDGHSDNLCRQHLREPCVSLLLALTD